jgi:hypothetical protein
VKESILDDSVDTTVDGTMWSKKVFIMLGLGTICKKEELDTMCDQFIDFGIELPDHPSEGDFVWVRCRIDLSQVMIFDELVY